MSPMPPPEDDIPRRHYVDRMVPAELAIRDAMHAVEAMGASEQLTKAITLLDEAKDAVSDHVDARRALDG